MDAPGTGSASPDGGGAPVGGRRGQRGAALLEFVIVFPVLLMLLFGAWEFGRIYDAWQVTVNAAREGARYGVAGSSDTDVASKVTDYLKGSFAGRLKSVKLASGTTLYNGSAGGDVAATIRITHPEAEQVQVVVTADVDIWAPAVAPLVGRSVFPVTAWSTMRQ